MKQLDKGLPRTKKRLFAFGCSFTEYTWSTWCDIVAHELQIPLWNYGRCGAGNPYIHYQIQQARNLHKFTETDLVMVMWSNVTRLDFFHKGVWHTPGNIYSQDVVPYTCARQLADPDGMLLRDCALIQSARDTLETTGCDYRMMQITDLLTTADLSGDKNTVTEPVQQSARDTFGGMLSDIYPAVDQTVWGCGIQDRSPYQLRVVQQTGYSDGHPYPTEHLMFLTKTFPDTGWSTSTVEAVNDLETRTTDYLNEFDHKTVYTLNSEQLSQLLTLRLEPVQRLRGLY